MPVVILSVKDTDRLEGYRLDANSYMRKPVDFVEFAQVVKQMGFYWQALNEEPPSSVHKLDVGS